MFKRPNGFEGNSWVVQNISKFTYKRSFWVEIYIQIQKQLFAPSGIKTLLTDGYSEGDNNNLFAVTV